MTHADREQATLLARIERIEDGWRRTNRECVAALNRAEAAEAKVAELERANRDYAVFAEARIAELESIELVHAGCAGLREKDNHHLIERAEAAERALADERARVARLGGDNAALWAQATAAEAELRRLDSFQHRLEARAASPSESDGGVAAALAGDA